MNQGTRWDLLMQKKPPSKMSCLGTFKQLTPLLNPLILWKVTGVDTSWILVYIDLFSKLKICCTLSPFAFRFLLVQCVTLSGFQGWPEKLGEIRHCLGTYIIKRVKCIHYLVLHFIQSFSRYHRRLAGGNYNRSQ
jgi:hypothetical protein